VNILKACIDRGLAYIAAQQLTAGGLASYSSQDSRNFTDTAVYQTTFFPSLVLQALTELNGSVAKKLKLSLADFLLAQKNVDWSFNYWDQSSKEYTELSYPNDLDDTFCAFAALWHYDESIFDGKTMAAIVQLLIRNEIKLGGPYKTWLVDADAPLIWRDVDVAVNTNIGYFLSLLGVEMGNVVTCVEKAIAGNGLHSPYYPDIYPLVYFVGRWYNGKLQPRLAELVLKEQTDGTWDSPLHTALAVTALLRLGCPVKQLARATQHLLNTQQADGSWPAAAFCIDPALKGKPRYAGAASLTTAFCLEALHLYDRMEQSELVQKVRPGVADKRYVRVKRKLVQVITELGHPDLMLHTKRVFKQIMAYDSDKQIVLLPWSIASAAKLDVNETLLQSLALASLWGWMAYTIYDDFLDNEGDPKLLPSANFCLRQLTSTLSKTLPDCTDFQTEVMAIMNRIDAANAWEASHCRGVIVGSTLRITKLPDYGDYWQLADRSLGHTISGLGVLYGAGFTVTSAPIQALRDFFKHYLIARQLHDDAHDWEEDLRRGHVNAVAVPIIKEWLKISSHALKKGINLQREAEPLRIIMWEIIITQICQSITDHVALARIALMQADPDFFDTMQLEAMLVPLEVGAQQALKGRDDALAFAQAL